MRMEVTPGVFMPEQDFKKVKLIFTYLEDLAREHAREGDNNYRVFLALIIDKFVKVYDQSGTPEQIRAVLSTELLRVMDQAEQFTHFVDTPRGAVYKVGRIEAVLS